MGLSGRAAPPAGSDGAAGRGLRPGAPETIAAAWGFAEATLFFLVPDVYLSRVALAAPRRALRACVWALAGALLGGAAMHLWGASDAAAAERMLDRLPAISPQLVERVRADLGDDGPVALFTGPLRGTPYKIYAVEAGVLGLPLAALLATSVPARLVRFLAVTALAAAIARLPGLRRLPLRRLRWIHAIAWTAFYTAYFLVMPG